MGAFLLVMHTPGWKWEARATGNSVSSEPDTARDGEMTLWKLLCFPYDILRIADEAAYCVYISVICISMYPLRRGESGKQHTGAPEHWLTHLYMSDPLIFQRFILGVLRKISTESQERSHMQPKEHPRNILELQHMVEN